MATRVDKPSRTAKQAAASAAPSSEQADQLAIPLAAASDEGSAGLIAGATDDDGSHSARRETLAPGRSLVLSEFSPPSIGASERLIRLAYRLGIPASTLTSPFAKPALAVAAGDG